MTVLSHGQLLQVAISHLQVEANKLDIPNYIPKKLPKSPLYRPGGIFGGILSSLYALLFAHRTARNITTETRIIAAATGAE